MRASGKVSSDLAELPPLLAALQDLDAFIAAAAGAPSKGYVILQAASPAPGKGAHASEKAGAGPEAEPSVGPLYVQRPVERGQRAACALTTSGEARQRPLRLRTTTASYDDVWPFVPAHLAAVPWKQYDSFDRAMDEFFSRMEGQKQEMKAVQQATQATKKIEAIRRDHHERVDALAQAQLTNVQKAQLIEYNLHLVRGAHGHGSHHARTLSFSRAR